MKSCRIFGASLAILLMTGCAVGNQYDYQNANLSLPVSGSGAVSVAVVDNRSYVLNGDKKPNFVGVQRGGYYNPFSVTTASGQSLTEDMANALENSLRNSGYSVSSLTVSSAEPSIVASTISESGKSRNIVLVVTEWKTDIYMKMSLKFDLLLQIIAADGTVIADNQMQGDQKISGAGLESQNEKTAMAEFESKIGRLFNDEGIIAALKN